MKRAVAEAHSGGQVSSRNVAPMEEEEEEEEEEEHKKMKKTCIL